jgi:hypothetical protein
MEKEDTMSGQIKILHIDPDYQVTSFFISENLTIKSTISLEKTIQLLNNENFDLILSEPHQKAILAPQTSTVIQIDEGGKP